MRESNPKHFLQITLSGEKIGPGRIPVNHLLRLLYQFNKALHRSAMVLLGEADSVRRGPRQRSIKDEISLDLVSLSHGSPKTILGFERSRAQQAFDSMDFGIEVIEKSLDGLKNVQEIEAELPTGFDSGVLLAWRDVGTLFESGITEMKFQLNHRPVPVTTNYSERGYKRIQERIQGPQILMRTIEGRLLMADFKEHGTRCRVHPSVGDPVFCLFDENQRDEVLENILHFVKVIGEAKEDPATGKITSIKIHDIQRLEEREEEAADLLPKGTPIPTDFWKSPTIEELAESQGVRPLNDVSLLFGTWPDDPNDGFEESIRELRQQSTAGNSNT